MLNNAIQQVDRLFDPSRLSLVIAMEGGNHIYFGASPQEAYECFADYCAARQAVGFKVIAVDTFPRMTGYWPGFVNVEGYALASMQYNQLVRANWPKFADLYFDARWHLPEFDARPPYMPDGVHPNIDGNARLAAKLATFISNNLRSEPQAIATVVD
jgi:lysophospholipase L1-like esterase